MGVGVVVVEVVVGQGEEGRGRGVGRVDRGLIVGEDIGNLMRTMVSEGDYPGIVSFDRDRERCLCYVDGLVSIGIVVNAVRLWSCHSDSHANSIWSDSMWHLLLHHGSSYRTCRWLRRSMTRCHGDLEMLWWSPNVLQRWMS